MKIINNGLPEPVYEWILASQGEYSKGTADISVTELINPPRPRILKKKHDQDIVVYASTLINVCLGQAVHKGIEEATKTGTAERRLSVNVLGWEISGGMDNYHDGVLVDYKTCNKWKTVLCNDGVVDEFEKQLNIYAEILRSNDIPVTELKIFAIFKDWNRAEFKTYNQKGKIFEANVKSGYPEKEWLYFPLRLWSEEEAKFYLNERVKIHQEAEKKLPFCQPHEIWGGRRCMDYCEVNNFCEQYQESRKTGLI